MSKEGLSKLNESLVKHFEEKGVKNAYYYEPLFDHYWSQKDKIGICNLEPYDNGLGDNLMGLKKVDDKVIVDCWYNSQTIQRTLKMFQLITKKIENDSWLTEEDYAKCDNKKVDEVVTNDLGSGLYFNFRLTVGDHTKENTAQIMEFYKDPFYQDYFKKFIKEAELNMLIVTGKTGASLMNMMFPNLNLEYCGKAKKIDGLLVCSAQHPASRDYSNKELVENINYFFDCYWEKE